MCVCVRVYSFSASGQQNQAVEVNFSKLPSQRSGHRNATVWVVVVAKTTIGKLPHKHRNTHEVAFFRKVDGLLIFLRVQGICFWPLREPLCQEGREGRSFRGRPSKAGYTFQGQRSIVREQLEAAVVFAPLRLLR